MYVLISRTCSTYSVQYVLVATRTPDELDTDTLTAADVWAFGCSVLKIFLSHSGPHSQKQVYTNMHSHTHTHTIGLSSATDLVIMS